METVINNGKRLYNDRKWIDGKGKVKMKDEKRNTEHPEKVNPMCENCGKFGGECQGTTEKVWTGCVFKTPKK